MRCVVEMGGLYEMHGGDERLVSGAWWRQDGLYEVHGGDMRPV